MDGDGDRRSHAQFRTIDNGRTKIQFQQTKRSLTNIDLPSLTACSTKPLSEKVSPTLAPHPDVRAKPRFPHRPDRVALLSDADPSNPSLLPDRPHHEPRPPPQERHPPNAPNAPALHPRSHHGQRLGIQALPRLQGGNPRRALLSHSHPNGLSSRRGE